MFLSLSLSFSLRHPKSGSLGREEGREGREGKGREGKGREGKGREGKKGGMEAGREGGRDGERSGEEREGERFRTYDKLFKPRQVVNGFRPSTKTPRMATNRNGTSQSRSDLIPKKSS